MALFLPTYFSPIAQYMAIANTDEVVFEVEDNFQKQTYRNRCYIYGSNGKQLLNIPTIHHKNTTKRKTKDTLVENNTNWQSQHFKSIQIAYRNSPFFEFYEDDLSSIFKKKYIYLLDVNIDTFIFLMNALQLPEKHSKTLEYNPSEIKNYYHLANAKQQPELKFEKYIQMFDEKHGFIENLSMLDLLFMEGPNAISFLEKNHLNLKKNPSIFFNK